MRNPIDELATRIASGFTTEEIANYQASDESKALVEELIHKEKTIGLTKAETAELDGYMQIEQLMQLVKAKARLLLMQ